MDKCISCIKGTDGVCRDIKDKTARQKVEELKLLLKEVTNVDPNGVNLTALTFAEEERQKSKNLWRYGDVSGTRWVTVNTSKNPILAGNYTLSAIATTDATTSDRVLIEFYDQDGKYIRGTTLLKNIRNSADITLEKDCYQVSFVSSPTAETIGFKYIDIMLTKDGSSDYQPHNGPTVHNEDLKSREIVYDLENNTIDITNSALTTLKEYIDLFNVDPTVTYITNIGTLDTNNFKNLVGNPTGFGNYTQVVIKCVSKGNVNTHFNMYEVIAFDNYQNAIAKGYIWKNVYDNVVFTGWTIFKGE